MTMSRIGSRGSLSGILTCESSDCVCCVCSAMTTLSLNAELLKITGEALAQFRILQAEFHGRLEKTQLIAGIEALSFNDPCVHRCPLGDRAQGVGELDLLIFSR